MDVEGSEAGRESRESGPRTSVGILLFDDVEELDFAGPWEVFAGLYRTSPSLGEVFTVAEWSDVVQCANGLRVLPEYSFSDAPPIDVLLVPGGEGTRREVSNAALIDWLRKVGEGCRFVTSVCTGALLLHEAGFARGRRVTTHRAFVSQLQARGDVTVLDGPRYVRDGNLVTAAGVSAGIDMALWLVGQLHSPAVARRIRRAIQYDPAPPYLAEV
jgi:transcriptional regulator GlxA family with amidase domain